MLGGKRAGRRISEKGMMRYEQEVRAGMGRGAHGEWDRWKLDVFNSIFGGRMSDAPKAVEERPAARIIEFEQGRKRVG